MERESHLMCFHVDDFLMGWNMRHPDVEEHMTALKNTIHFGKWENASKRVKFCGRYYKQDEDFSITVDMIDYVNNMTPVRVH